MDQVTVTVETEVNPTESEDKVRKSIENLFGRMEMQIKVERGVTALLANGRSRDNLTRLYNILRRERIRAAARKILLNGLDRNKIVFCLNKQVAYAGQISFSSDTAESPLGALKITIVSDDPRAVVDWLTKMERQT